MLLLSGNVTFIFSQVTTFFNRLLKKTNIIGK